MLCQIAGILVVIAGGVAGLDQAVGDELGLLPLRELVQPRAGLRVLRHPGAMAAALLVQDVGAVLGASGGLCGLPPVRAARSQQRRPKRAGARLERALPLVGVVSRDRAARLLWRACLVVPAEMVTRVVDLGRLRGRRSPRSAFSWPAGARKRREDYQRVRWVIWGCLIGLPTVPLAELASTTTFFDTRWGDFTPSEDITGLLYLVNGILCLFVFEALRRERVVSVTIPLRRVTILGLCLSVPVLLLHQRGRAHPGASRTLPGWAWIAHWRRRRVRSHACMRAPCIWPDRYFNRALERGRAEARAGDQQRRDWPPRSTGCWRTRPPRRSSSLRPRRSARRAGALRATANGKGWNRRHQTRTLKPDRAAARPGGEGQAVSAFQG